MLVNILMPSATNIIGYNINQLIYGTVKLTVSAITTFNNQLHISKHNLTGWLCQSFLIKLAVVCQSIKEYAQQFLKCLVQFRGLHLYR